MAPSDRPLESPGLDDFEYEALLPIWEEVLRNAPTDVAALNWLGHAYTRLGRIDDGLEIDLRLTRLRPDDAVAHYNLACSYALLGRHPDALEAIRKAVELGYRDADHMRRDVDLASLKKDPTFLEILSDLKE